MARSCALALKRNYKPVMIIWADLLTLLTDFSAHFALRALMAGLVMNFINGFCLTNGLLKGVKVLVVDNDRDSRDLYAFLLKDLSASVITAGSVKQALEILSWFTPNIIVSEIRFLGESIYTLLNTLSAMEADNGNHIPIIVTSTSTTGTHEQIPDVEFEEYLLKPFDLDKFVSMIINQVQEDVTENFYPYVLVYTNILSTSQGHNRVEFSSATCRNNTKE